MKRLNRRRERRAFAAGLRAGAWIQRAHDVWAIRNGFQPGIAYVNLVEEYRRITGVDTWELPTTTVDGPPLPIRQRQFEAPEGVRFP